MLQSHSTDYNHDSQLPNSHLGSHPYGLRVGSSGDQCVCLSVASAYVNVCRAAVVFVRFVVYQYLRMMDVSVAPVCSVLHARTRGATLASCSLILLMFTGELRHL